MNRACGWKQKVCTVRAKKAALGTCMIGVMVAAPCRAGAQMPEQRSQQQETLQPTQRQGAEPAERLYNHSQVEVDLALQKLHVQDTFRLPTLDGFAAASAESLSSFDNPHYQFKIGVFPQNSGQTLVQVTAKITAWYSDANSAHSQYVVIPSNGRLEEDLLDRLTVALEKQNPRNVSNSPGDWTDAGVEPASPGESGSANSAFSAGTPSPVTGTEALGARIVAVQAERQAVEQHVRKLEQQASELQANSRTQRYLSNLAVVKARQTPVLELAEVTSKVLFRADPEDEFEVLSAREDWVQIRLEDAGKGWIRVAQLQPPTELDDPETLAASTFLTPTEEVKAFEGDWPPLKGKMALFVFAQPAKAIPQTILGKAQLDFSKQMFTLGYREAMHSETPIEGVVVVFLGAKGGVASAALADIRRWREGLVTDNQFFGRCSFDPPESFRDAERH